MRDTCAVADSRASWYEASPRYRQEGYEDSFLQFCQSMLSDVEKRIRRARQRLHLSNQEGGVVIKMKEPAAPTDERVIVLNERIQGLLQQVEQLGCEGKVEEAQGIMKLCDQLKEERKSLDKDSDKAHWLRQTAELAAAQEKQMEVCDICGAFLIVGDAQQRVDDHLMGKQHMGYAKLKEAVEEILNRREKEREEKEKQRERERERRRRREEDDTRSSRRGAELARDDRRDRDEKRHRSDNFRCVMTADNDVRYLSEFCDLSVFPGTITDSDFIAAAGDVSVSDCIGAEIVAAVASAAVV
ncbi:hypothetical protein HPB51_008833 [Rhipicephalus microplus]|uniref:Luc7-like protein 3 n=1 Tax=Rhipicephalus microplus TaxID=6941 RepID=A0A9J6ESE8_RHIMP|nr:hypothetical protein HPB51_008833 [Rhipicephalus microplus]